MNIIVIRNKKIIILISSITIFFFKRKYVKNKIPKIITVKLKDFECATNWDARYEINKSENIPIKPIEPKLLVLYFINFSFTKTPKPRIEAKIVI